MLSCRGFTTGNLSDTLFDLQIEYVILFCNFIYFFYIFLYFFVQLFQYLIFQIFQFSFISCI